ncbi:MAG: PorP/SprF family type IX secretion system membrane protein [Bacteroidota bacterium]
MLRQIVYFLSLSTFLFASEVKAQDPVFSQFYAAPLQLNPAFAGNTYAPFITVNYRNQWSGFNDFKTYVTYAASFSQFIEGMNSGIGLMIQSDDAGGGIYKNTRVSAIYSYKVQVNQDFAIKFGIEGTAVQNRLDWNRLVFPDQIDPTGEINLMTGEATPNDFTKSYLDLSTGFLAYSKQFYGGVTIKHLNTPDESLLAVNNNINSGLPVRLSVHAGSQFPLFADSRGNSDAFIAPNIMFVKQADFGQVNAGAYFGFGAFFAGAWYRHAFSNGDAAIGLVGVQKGAMKFGYSYDFTVSQLSTATTGGTHEFSFIINLDQNQPRKRDYNDCFQIFR